MIFDLDVAEPHLVAAVMAVANAAKTAVENTAMHLAPAEHAGTSTLEFKSVVSWSYSRSLLRMQTP
ncbi:hypothetical protein [Bradyrhizobium sp. CCBAU 53380]|uniref:hypothetical protein n=1 Tax=Bradyrhizobium sp. CCBAU 53380 TaxID=1325117 RepID=UPI0023032AD6|nr:hypothetical protein [Bradyrhizobium sp. CCBAU 53380]